MKKMSLLSKGLPSLERIHKEDFFLRMDVEGIGALSKAEVGGFGQDADVTDSSSPCARKF